MSKSDDSKKRRATLIAELKKERARRAYLERENGRLKARLAEFVIDGEEEE